MNLNHEDKTQKYLDFNAQESIEHIKLLTRLAMQQRIEVEN